MDKPLVTVVTVTYNLIENDRKESFIKALASVQNQTYKNIEHIIIDGASQDGTSELIKEYSDKGWIKYISEPDAGLYDAMNKSALMAQGKYIIFLNSDDYFSGIEGIEKSVEALESNQADFSYTDCKIIQEDGITIADWHWQTKPRLFLVYTHMPFCHQTLMVKTELFKKLGMFNLKYKSAADYDFVLRLVLNKAKSVYVPYELVTFQLGGFSMNTRTSADQEVYDFFSENFNSICFCFKNEYKDMYSYKRIPRRLLKKLLEFIPEEDRCKLISMNEERYKGIWLKRWKKFHRFKMGFKPFNLTIFGIELIK